jgi:hypothetical protein
MKSLWKTGGGDASPYFPFVRDGGGGGGGGGEKIPM